MDWITQDYVKAEAKKGRKKALECTRLHWQQLVKAGPKELKKAFGIKRVTICSAHCAMCYKYLLSGAGMMCPRCLLKCRDVWNETRDAGYDCQKHGANNTNCHFRFFATKKLTAAWERGAREYRAENE